MRLLFSRQCLFKTGDLLLKRLPTFHALLYRLDVGLVVGSTIIRAEERHFHASDYRLGVQGVKVKTLLS